MPLHIFEQRYRDMVADSIDSGQWIGMVVLAPGWEDQYYGRPNILPIGCAGNIEKWTRHDDGKYDIVLRGQSRFRVIRELGETSYRQAEVDLLEPIQDQQLENGNPLKERLMSRYREFTQLLPEKNPQKVNPDLSECRTLSEVIDRLAFLFDLTFEERWQFLQEPDVVKRYQSLLTVIDMKIKIVQRSATMNQFNVDFRMN